MQITKLPTDRPSAGMSVADRFADNGEIAFLLKGFHMVLLIAGAFLFVAGLFSGVSLALTPFGLLPLTSGPASWLLFPSLCFFGYALMVVSLRMPSATRLSYVASTVLLVLGLFAATELVAASGGLIRPILSTLPTWYVLVVAGALGTLGVAAKERSPTVVTA